MCIFCNALYANNKYNNNNKNNINIKYRNKQVREMRRKNLKFPDPFAQLWKTAVENLFIGS